MVRVPDIPNFNTNEDVAKTVEELKNIGIINIDRFAYIEDSIFRNNGNRERESK